MTSWHEPREASENAHDFVEVAACVILLGLAFFGVGTALDHLLLWLAGWFV